MVKLQIDLSKKQKSLLFALNLSFLGYEMRPSWEKLKVEG